MDWSGSGASRQPSEITMSARKFREWLDAVRRLLDGKGGRVAVAH
jgi:hypothetical protein